MRHFLSVSMSGHFGCSFSERSLFRSKVLQSAGLLQRVRLFKKSQKVFILKIVHFGRVSKLRAGATFEKAHHIAEDAQVVVTHPKKE